MWQRNKRVKKNKYTERKPTTGNINTIHHQNIKHPLRAPMITMKVRPMPPHHSHILHFTRVPTPYFFLLQPHTNHRMSFSDCILTRTITLSSHTVFYTSLLHFYCNLLPQIHRLNIFHMFQSPSNHSTQPLIFLLTRSFRPFS